MNRKGNHMLHENKISLKRPKLLIWAVLIIAPLSGMGVDIYVPSLPAMHDFFGVSVSLIKLTVSLYIVGYGLGSFLFSPLGDFANE